MRAAVIHRFGPPDVLEVIHDAKKPRVEHNQVLIEVRAAGVNPLDWKTRSGGLRVILGSRFPMILGNDAAGVVVETGSGVTTFSTGDEVYGMLDSNATPARSGFAGTGAYAEYAVTRADTLAPKPGTVTFDEAASIPLCALTAYQVLAKQFPLRHGSRVLINGASGGVGSAATQIAKSLGAHVTAVCGPRRAGRVRELGADEVIDYSKSDWTQGNAAFDLIYDVAVTTSFRRCKHRLRPDGVFVSNMAPLYVILLPFLRRRKLSRRRGFAWVESSGDHLREISAMLEAGQMRPVVDRVFSLDEIADAHEYSERGAGKAVVRVAPTP